MKLRISWIVVAVLGFASSAHPCDRMEDASITTLTTAWPPKASLELSSLTCHRGFVYSVAEKSPVVFRWKHRGSQTFVSAPDTALLAIEDSVEFEGLAVLEAEGHAPHLLLLDEGSANIFAVDLDSIDTWTKAKPTAPASVTPFRLTSTSLTWDNQTPTGSNDGWEGLAVSENGDYVFAVFDRAHVGGRDKVAARIHRYPVTWSDSGRPELGSPAHHWRPLESRWWRVTGLTVWEGHLSLLRTKYVPTSERAARANEARFGRPVSAYRVDSLSLDRLGWDGSDVTFKHTCRLDPVVARLRSNQQATNFEGIARDDRGNFLAVTDNAQTNSGWSSAGDPGTSSSYSSAGVFIHSRLEEALLGRWGVYGSSTEFHFLSDGTVVHVKSDGDEIEGAYSVVRRDPTRLRLVIKVRFPGSHYKELVFDPSRESLVEAAYVDSPDGPFGGHKRWVR